jgi:uncharacterized metal-binding protein YceD (DUF177 family)
MNRPPLERFFDLGDLSQAGSEVVVEASPADLPGLAQWAGVEAVNGFKAAVSLKRLSQSRFTFEADLEADIVQSCVVTLEPVPSRLACHITRELHLASRLPRGLKAEAGELTLSAGDDDVPETITSLDYDLAAPLLEEFVLAIDPYPRKAGSAFAVPPEQASKPQTPFAALKSLKEKG